MSVREAEDKASRLILAKVAYCIFDAYGVSPRLLLLIGVLGVAFEPMQVFFYITTQRFDFSADCVARFMGMHTSRVSRQIEVLKQTLAHDPTLVAFIEEVMTRVRRMPDDMPTDELNKKTPNRRRSLISARFHRKRWVANERG